MVFTSVDDVALNLFGVGAIDPKVAKVEDDGDPRRRR
jgi:hypothetical protein